MSEPPEPIQPRPQWPWLLLAGVILAAVLAFVWVSAEVRRVKNMERFDYREPKNPASNSPAAIRSTNSLITGFLDALNGGDPARGRNLFFNKPEASCGKCHRVGNQGGDNGPALDGIGSRATREFILESMVAPNASISKGYESVVVRLRNGSGLAGVLREETEASLVIHTPDDGPITVVKTNVLERSLGISPMPADFPTLISKAELRDLVAFLTSLTNNVSPERGIHSAPPRN